MGIFNKISSDAFSEFQFNSGMLLKTFNPAKPAPVTDENIICATTGGIKHNCTPNIIDFSEDVDNIQPGTMEFMQLDYFEAKMSFTALNISADVLRLALGVADVSDSGGVSTITPTHDIKPSHFSDVWWVGDLVGGGWAAICLKNALGGGLDFQTTKKGKGQLSVELTGHYSIDAQNEVPMQFYVSKGAAA